MIADDPIHIAQRTFRALLAALAHPGRITPIDEFVDAPAALGEALAAGALALFDREVAVWLAPTAPAGIGAWLAAQTNCRLVSTPKDAQFAVILDPQDALPLDRWNIGTPEDPEHSATLLMRVEGLSGGTEVRLSGPGIEHEVTLTARGVPPDFWREWAANTARYPAGIDCFLFEARSVAGLSRTTVERST